MTRYPQEFINQTEELKESITKFLEVLHEQKNSNLAFYDLGEKTALLSREWVNKYHSNEHP
ncbi:MAG: hypothetical protein KAT52_07895 [Desulfobacterales bacterium]|nr:hypothetical protein [Desulfobacterales bacterium]